MCICMRSTSVRVKQTVDGREEKEAGNWARHSGGMGRLITEEKTALVKVLEGTTKEGVLTYHAT